MFHFVGIAVIVKDSMEIANVINIVDTANAADKFEYWRSYCRDCGYCGHCGCCQYCGCCRYCGMDIADIWDIADVADIVDILILANIVDVQIL